jgi:hypothetical protein
MKPIPITDNDLQTLEMMGGAVNSGRPDVAQPGRTIASLRNDHIVWYNDLIRRAHDAQKTQEQPAPPGSAELLAWGDMHGDSEGSSRRVSIVNGVVYTMRVPGKGLPVTASLAIVPGGSGSIGGKLSAVKWDLAGWDGTGGGAGGSFLDGVRDATGDWWFTFRLGVDQPSTDVNVLVQYG